jgi:hypothetical protein
MMNRVSLKLLADAERPGFLVDTGRLYGSTSKYVHLTSAQIVERIDAVKAGRTAGKESASDIEAVNALAVRVLAVSLVYILHAVPEYVAGDLLVEADGT